MQIRPTWRSASRAVIPVLAFLAAPRPHAQSGLPEVEKALVAAVATARQSVVPLLVHRHRASSPTHQSCLFRISSGILLDSSGLILSSSVIATEGAQFDLIVGQQRRQATLLGSDPLTGLCALKVSSVDGLRPIETADAASLAAGRMVLVLGYSASLLPQATLAVAGGVGDSVLGSRLGSFFQFTSLGPLPEHGAAVLDLEGHLVGLYPGQGPIGAGRGASTALAMPLPEAKELALQLAKDHTVRRPWLGITIDGPDPQLGALLGLTGPASMQIARVEPGSPAARAGLRHGDRVLRVHGQPVATLAELVRAIEAVRSEKTVPIEVQRNDEAIELYLTLENRPSGGVRAATLDWFGVRLAEAARPAQVVEAGVPDAPAGAPGAELVDWKATAGSGVVVQEVVCPTLAEWLGLKAGDRIVSLNGQAVEDIHQFEDNGWLEPSGGPVRMEIDRDGQILPVEFPALDLRTDPSALLVRLLRLEAGVHRLLEASSVGEPTSEATKASASGSTP